MTEPLPPSFHISHSLEKEFPTEEERLLMGYSPLDLFLVDEVDEEGPLSPVLYVYGDSAPGLLENLNDDFLLTFRYKREGFNLKSHARLPRGEREVPAIQRELCPATLGTGDHLEKLSEILNRTVDEATEAKYMYQLDMRTPEGAERCKSLEEYLDHISDTELRIWPEMNGLQQIDVRPQNLYIRFNLYQQEVKVMHESPEFGAYDISDPEGFQETVHLNYDESPIDNLKEELENEDFHVEKVFLSDTEHPSDI
jgi:hypothetical protein